jgi:glucose-6-phosphate-specific signal transduction histidine kinase
VTNQDLAADEHIDGFGIAGMRRRITHLGGRLTAAPRGGLFEVRASIPVS